MAATEDDMLREAAKARGFRLVKSRRRKAGGDFGRYGLVDARGRECLGFGPDGFTASADEVHAYLRGGEVASWKRSLIGTVGSEAPTASVKKTKKELAPSGPVKATEKATNTPPRARAEALAKPAKPEPALAIREATRRDAGAIARLVGIPAPALAERIAAAIAADQPPLVAERDGIIGVAAWTMVASLQHGAAGRVTLLEVAEAERRQGLGRQLLDAVEQRLAAADISRLELQLGIDLDAPAGFLRRTGWARTTNGYGKELGT